MTIEAPGTGGTKGVEDVREAGPAEEAAAADAAEEAPARDFSQGKAIGGSTAFRGGFAQADIEAKLREREAKVEGGAPSAATAAPADADAEAEAVAAKKAPDRSPTGVAYGDKPKALDREPIFDEDGKLRPDATKILTQADLSTGTASDPERCGATAAIGAAFASGGPEAAKKVADAARKELEAKRKGASPEAQKKIDQQIETIDEVKKKIDDKTATFGDLARLGEAVYTAYGRPGKGMSGAAIGELFRDAGMKVPSKADPAKIEKGNAWPAIIDTDEDGQDNHWVAFGKDPSGRDYVYDPLPKPGEPQIIYKDQDPAKYEKYKDAAKGGDTFALDPDSKKAKDFRAREKVEEMVELGKLFPFDQEQIESVFGKEKPDAKDIMEGKFGPRRPEP